MIVVGNSSDMVLQAVGVEWKNDYNFYKLINNSFFFIRCTYYIMNIDFYIISNTLCMLKQRHMKL